MGTRALFAILPLLVACDPSTLADLGLTSDASTVATPAPKSTAAPASKSQADRFKALLAGRSLNKLIRDLVGPDAEAIREGPSRDAYASAQNADARCAANHSTCQYVKAELFKEWQTATGQAAASITSQLQQEATAASEGDAPFIAFIGLQVQAEAATVSAAPPQN